MPRRSFFLLPLVLIALLAGSACVERSKVPTDAGSTTPAPAATTGTTDTTAPATGEETAAPTKTCPVPRVSDVSRASSRSHPRPPHST